MSGAPRALVVYESMLGNTQQVAEAIGNGLKGSVQVELVEVGGAPAHLPADVDLLIVGGPTHVFGMSRSTTRTSASGQGQVVMSPVTGIREWLAALAYRQGSVTAATFDTRINKVRRLTGSAARGAAKVLHARGFPLLAAPASFFVEDSLGPLAESEVERCRRWGEELATALRQASRPRVPTRF